jgi:hypothetical protein
LPTLDCLVRINRDIERKNQQPPHPGAVHFRIATGRLYGSGERERWESLRSEDPLELPRIAGPLAELDDVFAVLKAG